MARIIVLAARKYSIQNDDGSVNEGINLDGCESFQNDDPDYKGRGGMVYKASEAAWNMLKDKQLPAICEVDLSSRKGKNKRDQAVAIASVEEVYAVHPIDFNVPAARKAA